MLRNKVRNIIDNNVDNGTVTKTSVNWSAGLSVGLVLKKAELRKAASCDGERAFFFSLLRVRVLSNAGR